MLPGVSSSRWLSRGGGFAILNTLVCGSFGWRPGAIPLLGRGGSSERGQEGDGAVGLTVEDGGDSISVTRWGVGVCGSAGGIPHIVLPPCRGQSLDSLCITTLAVRPSFWRWQAGSRRGSRIGPIGGRRLRAAGTFTGRSVGYHKPEEGQSALITSKQAAGPLFWLLIRNAGGVR